MASNLATILAAPSEGEPDHAEAIAWCDRKLAPIRECLEELMEGGCWCQDFNLPPHSPACLKAQEVWKALEK